ncbi:hypothetical protein TNCV_1132861 [Trichonephila clavipes]|nr:hypothetical protein TNCV_1132861 [Trichonephila clavipes]
MIPAYNKKRCAAFPFETGIHFRRKTDFFPEEGATMSYLNSNPNPLGYKPRDIATILAGRQSPLLDVAEGVGGCEMHRPMKAVNGESVCVVKTLWNGAKDSLEDVARPGQAHRVVAPEMIAEGNALVLDNRSMTIGHWVLAWAPLTS